MNGFMNITDWNANMAESTWAKNANALMDKMLAGVTNGPTEIYCQDEAAAKRLLDFVMREQERLDARRATRQPSASPGSEPSPR